MCKLFVLRVYIVYVIRYYINFVFVIILGINLYFKGIYGKCVVVVCVWGVEVYY